MEGSSWPRVTSTYHPGKMCGPCFICGKEQPRYDHFAALGSTEQDFFHKHMCSNIDLASCMCRSHSKEARRYISDPTYSPTWGDERSLHVRVYKCIYPECNITSLTGKIIEPSTEIQPSFCVAIGLSECTGTTVTLCETHYQTTYRQMHLNTLCSDCGAKPKARQGAYTRHSPNAITISQYLRDKTGYDVSIEPTDTLCKSCYNMHLVILQDIQRQGTGTRTTCTQSMDSSIISWNMKMQDDNTDPLTKVILRTVLFVAKTFMQDRALLLPQVVTFFLSNYALHVDTENTGDIHLELEDGNIKFSATHRNCFCAAASVHTVLFHKLHCKSCM